jgi:CHAT domain-containing protein
VIERHRPLSFFEFFWELITRHPRWSASAFGPGAVKVWWLAPAVGVYLWACLGGADLYEGWGLSHWQAWLLALILALLGLSPIVIILAKMMTTAYSRLRPSSSLLLACAAPPTVYATAFADVGLGLSLASALLFAFAFSMFAFLYVRGALAKIPNPVSVQLWLDDPTHAESLRRECEQALDDPELTPKQRAAVEANLASAMTAIAVLSGSDDRLPRAYEILTASLEDMDPMDAYVSVARLVDAMGAKAIRTGDIEGYEEALRLMLDTAGLVAAGQLRCIVARARLIHGTHLAELANRARSDGQPGRAARLHQEALDDLLLVFELSSPRSTVHVLAEVKFASLTDRDDGGLDAAIALCRRARRHLWLRSRLERDYGRLALCDLLTARAQLGGARARRDLAGATRLCHRLLRHAASHTEGMRRLPLLLRLRGAEADAVGRAYRSAFEELSAMSGAAAGELAADWSAWALASGTAGEAEAAEAHWCWIRAVAADARRRPLRAEKERRLSHVLGIAAQTGECLVVAGRHRDAAVALDLGRAMLMTERMSRDRDGVVTRLAEAGRADLADRWQEAHERISQADRAAFSAGAPSQTMLFGGRRFQARFTSSDHLALSDVEQLLREIGQVPGCEDVDAPPDYDDLRAAASEGPIVYLSAGAAHTLAVIVTEAPEPVVVELAPTLDELTALARPLAEATNPGEVMDLLTSIIPALWTGLMQPVAAHLAPGALVTLIPLGALSLLPLHVAGLMCDDDGNWHDHSGGLVYRYAPNARVLSRAQAHASALAGRQLPVLTVDVPDAPGESRLPCASAESAGVVARLGASRAQRPVPPTRGAVLRAMDTCGIWHFACHGIHQSTDPLESSLVLADGRLTLRAIFARPPGPRRLAVLSACRTATPAERLLDEVVSFPSALLQSGVAGVVCAQSDIVDRAAMLLVLRFFDELEHDDAPPRALARAQAWLRGATNAQIHAALADAYPLPSDYSPTELAEWSELREFTDPICWAPLSYAGA